MTEKNYSVVFRGDIVIGKSLPEVKQKLKQIFKVDDARIDSLFIGKPVPLKTNLSQQEAEKYQTILRQAGVVVAIESATSSKVGKPSSPNKAVETNVQPKEVKTESKTTDEDEWQLAPVGSLLQDKKTQKQEETDVNVEHLSLLPQEGNLLKDNERQPVPQPAVDPAALDWELTPYGEALLKETEKKKVSPVDVDVTSFSLAENEGNLIKESERKKVEAVDIDTSHLQLVSNEQSSPDN